MAEAVALVKNSIFKARVPIVKPVLPEIGDLAQELGDILQSGILSKGATLGRFEDEIAAHLGVKHAVGVSSCTTGLMLTYQACGLTGDVVVPSFTFMATVSALRWAGLRPIFADVDAKTTNLDPVAAEEAITPQTQAIVAVHNSGNPAEIDALELVARKHGIRLIFDSAHGFGSLYQGRALGPQGDASVFSLSATKLLVAGEGGIVATNDDEIAGRVRIGREFGNCGNYDSVHPGLNARMTEFNALLGRHGLRNLEAAALHRNRIATLYRQKLSGLPGVRFQQVKSGNRSSCKDFSVMIDADAFGLTRNELSDALAAENIETRKYYDPPVHLQRAYEKFARPGQKLPNTDLLASSILSLPMWSDMDASVVSGICLAIEKALESGEVNRAEVQQGALV
ncbi:MAG TPA: DegT/DnrJ/EryC1/StrS family aminotransferase [Pyrinomonadaceae bacterium]|nr:DegT/DnrJ/EryC1/StrS family aminotransferase [Pyrinomonadaceae bacterium]